MKINSLMFSPGADLYYDKAFRDTMEAHMEYFRSSRKTQVYDVDPQRAVVYQGDLFGFLLEIKIQPQYHWIVMRMNNFFSPYEFGPQVHSLMIPSNAEVDRLKQTQKIGGSLQV